MLAKILAWIAGGGLSSITKQLQEAYQAKLNAKNDSERIDAEKLIAQLEARQSILIAEQSSAVTRWIRPAFALPFVIYNAKVLVWDKVFALGYTDPMSTEYWQLQMIIFGAYFLTRPFEKR